MDESLQIGRQEQDALVRSVSLINDVVKQMKQIPELPSEKPTDNHPLTKVEFGNEDGIYTYMKDYDYPYRGYPYYEFVDRIDAVKKISRGIQSGFYHGLKKSWLRWLLIPFIPTLGRSVFWSFCYSFDRLFDRMKMRPNRFSEPVRELFRAASISWGDESEEIADLRKMLRNIECHILEFDNAYRFRVQDIVPEINKDNLRKNPRQEINRLLDIWIERETVVDVKNSWVLLRLFNNWYLRFDKPLRQMIVRILLEIDPERVKMIDGDKYFAIPRKDYTFGFMINPSETDKKLIAKTRMQRKFDEDREKIQKQSTIEHQFLQSKHQAEQQKVASAPENSAKLIEEQRQLDEKFKLVLQQNQQQFEIANQKVIANNLTDEQKKIYTKQQAELVALDKSYDERLDKLDRQYLTEKLKI